MQRKLTVRIDNLHIEGSERGVTHQSVDGVSMSVEDVPAPLTIAEKERRIHDMLIQEGSDARADGENVNWRIGRAAVKYVETFAADSGGNVDAKKRVVCLKEYAIGIGMIDNTKRIHEFYSVCAFWSESAQAHFENVSWSRMRECSRHGLNISQASTILHQHGDAPVAKLRKIILDTHGRAAPPKSVTATFEAHLNTKYPLPYLFHVEKEIEFGRMVMEHPAATVQIVVTWTPGAA